MLNFQADKLQQLAVERREEGRGGGVWIVEKLAEA